jgi:hypothetical protein
MIWRATLTDRQSIIELEIHYRDAKPINHPPVALHVNRESRHEASRVLEELIFNDEEEFYPNEMDFIKTSGVYLDPSTDIVYLRKRGTGCTSDDTRDFRFEYYTDKTRQLLETFAAETMESHQLRTIQHLAIDVPGRLPHWEVPDRFQNGLSWFVGLKTLVLVFGLEGRDELERNLENGRFVYPQHDVTEVKGKMETVLSDAFGLETNVELPNLESLNGKAIVLAGVIAIARRILIRSYV